MNLEQANQRLREELERRRLLANNVPVAVAYFESAGFTCVLANSGYAAMFGLDETSVVGRTFAQIIGEEAAARIDPQVQIMLRDHVRAVYERELLGPDGLTRYIDVNLLPHLTDDGELLGAFVLIADITRHRRAEIALRKSEERLAKFMHASVEGIVFHQAGNIIDANPPLLHLLGYKLDEVLGKNALDFIAPDERERVAAIMAAAKELTYDSALLRRDGSVIPVEFIARNLVYGGVTQRMTIVRDRRDRLRAQEHIQHMAHHDGLTGLPNRSSFHERVQELIARGETGQHGAPGFALLFIDLDHFKRVNDSLGHLAGDTLLQVVAQRIQGALRGNDLVARFGGDEFVVVLSGAPSPQAVQEVANKLLMVVGEPVPLPGSNISVTPSIGVALYPDDGATAALLIQHADTAMYHAKKRGRAHCCFFEPQMAEVAFAALEMEGRLRQAILQGEFVLHFQPQIAPVDPSGQGKVGAGRLVGVEALIRWAHPTEGLILPDAFLPVAEARRLILPIADWVLRDALRCAAAWRAAGLLRVPMAVNLSQLQFQMSGFVESVQTALDEAGADGSWLELELTEHMLMDDMGSVRNTLMRLKAMGVGVAVDDFGTGYSSLAHLKALPIDRLKIDRSFIKDLPAEPGSAAIARAIIQMGASLGLGVVAEGVETLAQSQWLAANGGANLQGLLVAQAMPEQEMWSWLATRAAGEVSVRALGARATPEG